MSEAPVKLYPTVFTRPLWCRQLSLQLSLSNIKISDPSVRLLSSEFNLRGLCSSHYMPKIPVTLESREAYERLSTEIPVDGREIVEWMLISAAENAVMQARISEYNRLPPAMSPQLVGNSGDPYIPGVIVEDIRYASETGSTVSSRGFAVAQTPRGNFNVPSGKKSAGVFKDLITWGSISWMGALQWTGNLLKWKSLAETPITQSVGFYMDNAGNVAPNFFVQKPSRPSLTVTVRQVISCNNRQTLNINFRDPTNYSNVLGTKKVDVASGTNQITYTVSAFPYVPPLIAEIQPQDNIQTKLDEYVVV